jgi:hypothetical protein
MNVTREVIYDVLPGYFAGEVSADTKRLVDEFLRADPEFAQMMERFRLVFRERPSSRDAAASRDAEAFERARAFLQKRSELRGYVVAFALAAAFVPMVTLFAARPMNIGFWAMTAAFAATSAISGFQLWALKDPAAQSANR